MRWEGCGGQIKRGNVQQSSANCFPRFLRGTTMKVVPSWNSIGRKNVKFTRPCCCHEDNIVNSRELCLASLWLPKTRRVLVVDSGTWFNVWNGWNRCHDAISAACVSRQKRKPQCEFRVKVASEVNKPQCKHKWCQSLWHFPCVVNQTWSVGCLLIPLIFNISHNHLYMM